MERPLLQQTHDLRGPALRRGLPSGDFPAGWGGLSGGVRQWRGGQVRLHPGMVIRSGLFRRMFGRRRHIRRGRALVFRRWRPSGCGAQQAAPILLEGLRRLEYRGYDSAGVAVHGGAGIEMAKASGKLQAENRSLRMQLQQSTMREQESRQRLRCCEEQLDAVLTETRPYREAMRVAPEQVQAFLLGICRRQQEEKRLNRQQRRQRAKGQDR